MNKLTLLFLVFQLFSNSLSAQEKFKVKELEKSLKLIPAESFTMDKAIRTFLINTLLDQE